MIQRNKLFFLCFFMLYASCIFAVERYPFKTSEQAQQFSILTEQLRCLVCQNESIADSNAALAADLRQQVYDQIQQGKSNQEIITYFVARYGDFVLFKPPIDSRTYALWYGPFIILVIGFLILWIAIKRNKS